MPKDEELGLTGKGVERVKIRGLDAAIADWEDKKSTRAQALSEEVAAKRKVFDLMHKNREDLPKNEAGFAVYTDGEKIYTLEEKLKSKKVSTGEEEEE